MPTYEYVCTNCQNQWEEIQKISEDPIKVCPKCSESTAKRQISGGSFILKGGGWYADLYSSSSNSKKSEKSEGASPGSSSSESTKAPTAPPAGETKPASTAPAKTESK
jgi:putative FmdB family regulatory protein